MRVTSNTDSESRIINRFGIVSIELAPGSEAVLAETKSIGFVTSPLGYNLGYSSQMIAALPPMCRVVFWVTDIKQLEKIKELLGNVEAVCPLLTKTERKNND